MEPQVDILKIRAPDDLHVHFRDGVNLEAIVGFTARQFSRAIVMPNLASPVSTVKAATAYRDRISKALGEDSTFEPLMTCYLTDDVDADEIEAGFKSKTFHACKLYPANATTNSAYGVTDIAKIYPVLERMQSMGMPLLVHGEVADPSVDIFDREAVFIERVLSKAVEQFPALKVVFEHITTKDAVAFVSESSDRVAATITPHHLAFNRNAIFEGGIRPHHYCLPVAKREIHRLALRKAATSGSAKFFLGTDSAPHAVEKKESACGCAGIFNAPVAMESYAKTFDEENALPRLEAFASENGARFYGLPLNESVITLQRQDMAVPSSIRLNDCDVVPYLAGQSLPWKLGNTNI
jgi:dihydroorotase